MLISFTVENFGSIRDEQTISLVACNYYKEREEWLARAAAPGLAGCSVLKAAGIYGANAAGKSMVLDALSVMRRVVRESPALMPDAALPYVPFRLGARRAGAPTRFGVEFLHGGRRYEYSFSYLPAEVVSERLVRYETSRAQLLFERGRAGDGALELKLTGRTRALRRHEAFLRAKPTSLLLSRGAQEGDAILAEPYEWLSRRLAVTRGTNPSPAAYGPVLDGELGEGLRERLVSMARFADLGVTDVRVKEVPPLPEERLREIYSEELARRLGDSVGKRAAFVHAAAEGDVEFAPGEESLGTETFFSIAANVLRALSDGSTLAVDEVDASLHPSLTEAVLALFGDERTNPLEAQLIFTAHDTGLMDSLRRDQLWLVSKDAAGATSVEPMSDYAPRKGERLSSGYEAGRYGAVPLVYSLLGGGEAV